MIPVMCFNYQHLYFVYRLNPPPPPKIGLLVVIDFVSDIITHYSSA